jgi:hypothetical protein
VQEQQNAPALRLFSELSTTQVCTPCHDSAEPQQQCRRPCENLADHRPASLKWNAPALLALSCLSDVVLIGLPISLSSLTRITTNNDGYALKWDQEQDYVGTWFCMPSFTKTTARTSASTRNILPAASTEYATADALDYHS